jgi:SAM-dependent methyltransferase
MSDINNLYDSKDKSYYKNVRIEIMPLLPENIDKIFEIGCGTGETLSYIKNVKHAKWTGGIELTKNTKKIKKNKDLDLIIYGDIENTILPFKKASLDIILCLDVLEHLNNPWAVLKKLRAYLKKDGVIICSIPNVRNYKVLFPLLFLDNWNYSENGILDKTHLRFFTKKTSIKLIEESGFKVNSVTSLIYGKNIYANFFTFNIFKPLFSFQYLIKAKLK